MTRQEKILTNIMNSDKFKNYRAIVVPINAANKNTLNQFEIDELCMFLFQFGNAVLPSPLLSLDEIIVRNFALGAINGKNCEKYEDFVSDVPGLMLKDKNVFFGDNVVPVDKRTLLPVLVYYDSNKTLCIDTAI